MRAAAAATGLIAVVLATWVKHEGDGPTEIQNGQEVHLPYVPTQGDVPTIGHGSTAYEDGTAVKLTDPPITRQRADELAAWHLSNTYMKCTVKSLGDTLIQPGELGIAIDHSGQYGCTAWASSPMLRAYKAGDYVGACRGYREYKFMTSPTNLGAGWKTYRTAAGKTRWRYDCSTPGNKVCRGVWTRSLTRYDDCMALQGV